MNTRLIRKMILITAGALTLADCGSGARPKAASAPIATGVKVEVVRLRPLPRYDNAPGTVRSVTTSVLAAQIGGAVRKVYVIPGEHVLRGQLLALLDDRSVHAQWSAAEAGVVQAAYGMAEVAQALEAAKAQSHLADVTYKRYQALLAKDSVSRAEFDQAEASYKSALANQSALQAKQKQVASQREQAQSEAAAARTAFSYSRIVSPIDGLVSAKAVDAGTVVMPGVPLLTIEDPSHYRLEASLPEEDLAQVPMGEKVAVSLSHDKLQGRIVEIVPSADPASRTFLIKIDLPKVCHCNSGEYGTAEILLGEEKGLAVPTAALVARGELAGVFVISDGGDAEFRLVRTGRTYGGLTEILSGLSQGDRVAISGTDQLGDGARVEGQ